MGTMVTLKPPVQKVQLQASRSSFAAGDLANAFSRMSVARVPVAQRPVYFTVEASRVCDMTGKRRNNANSISFSGKRNAKIQNPNLQKKYLYWPEQEKMVRMKIAVKTMRTIDKLGLQVTAKKYGVNLHKFPYKDVSDNRVNWLAANKGHQTKAKVLKDDQFSTNFEAFKEERRAAHAAWKVAQAQAEERSKSQSETAIEANKTAYAAEGRKYRSFKKNGRTINVSTRAEKNARKAYLKKNPTKV